MIVRSCQIHRGLSAVSDFPDNKSSANPELEKLRSANPGRARKAVEKSTKAAAAASHFFPCLVGSGLKKAVYPTPRDLGKEISCIISQALKSSLQLLLAAYMATITSGTGRLSWRKALVFPRLL